jgi:fructuronate reductase
VTAERLSNRTLARLPAAVRRPGYDRAAMDIGVVHFGPGAFHRAHQAWYFDRMLEADPRFAVSAVSLRSDDLRAALQPQDGLYTLIEREAEPRVQVIGSIAEVLTAPRAPQRVLDRLQDPAVRVVTMTVTEKGYCLTPSGDLDLEHSDIRRDLLGGAPSTLPGWMIAGLARRKAAGTGGLTAISCDNLSGNGKRLQRAVTQFAEASGRADLARWIEDEVRFPCSMVDSITPATDDDLRARAEAMLGLRDAWPVQRERFTQWVIETGALQDQAAFAAAGVTFTRDVAAFEKAKLRLLNGAHSTLAYLGLLLGYGTVAEAMADDRLAALLERLMRQDIAPAAGDAEGLDQPAYIGQILARFRNPAIAHQLSQIAWDGSQKLPFRLLETAAESLAAGRPVTRLAVGVAAWMAFVRRQVLAGVIIVDPMAGELARLAAGAPETVADRLLNLEPVFGPLGREPRFAGAVKEAYAVLAGNDPRQVLAL